MDGEVGSFGHVLPDEPVPVLVAAPLPRRMWVAEEHLDAGVDGELVMVGHLSALVPGQRSEQLLW